MTFAISVASAQPSIHPVPLLSAPAALTRPPVWVTFVSGPGAASPTVTEFKFILSDTELYGESESVHELSIAGLPCSLLL